jgi:hypothetical protein
MPYAEMRILTPEGPDTVEVADSSEASMVGGYWSALGHYLETGDDSRLDRFQGAAVRGKRFETDLEAILFWAIRDELKFNDPYNVWE